MSTISHTSEFSISQAVEKVFSLFSPEGEKLWVPGWEYVNIMGTTSLHEDYVFLTKNHDHAASDAIWLVKKYEPDIYRVQYYKIEPEEKVGVVTVTCEKLAEESTSVQVTYTYIGLSKHGNKFVEGFTENGYEEFIGDWKDLLTKYFDKRG